MERVVLDFCRCAFGVVKATAVYCSIVATTVTTMGSEGNVIMFGLSCQQSEEQSALQAARAMFREREDPPTKY